MPSRPDAVIIGPTISNTPRDVSVKLPKCWKVTSARITDSAGQDRKLDPAAKYTMESNSIILLEIEKR